MVAILAGVISLYLNPEHFTYCLLPNQGACELGDAGAGFRQLLPTPYTLSMSTERVSVIHWLNHVPAGA